MTISLAAYAFTIIIAGFIGYVSNPILEDLFEHKNSADGRASTLRGKE